MGKPLEFVAGACDRQAFAQAVLCDLLSFAGDAFDGLEGAPHQQIAAGGGDQHRQGQSQRQL